MLKNIIFIDSRVAGYQNLVTQLGTDAEWHVLVAGEDGLDQMQRILVGRTGLDAIHIVSHGSVGTLYLGSSVLNSANLASYQSQLQVIGAGLSNTSDILLYGCNVAQGDAGMQFIQSFSQFTGTDVAASDDVTGLGGDEQLEQTTGYIETKELELTKLTPNLALNGEFVTSDLGGLESGNIVIVQADGKILVAGNRSTSTDYGFFIARYNSDGTLDTTFSSGGFFIKNQDFGKGMAVQTDGKIIMAGGYLYEYNLIRLNSNGTLDSTFSNDGIITTTLSGGRDPQCMVIQPDGKILVAGSGGEKNFAMVRYNNDGTLDSTFATNGILINSTNFIARSITLQADGMILVAGHSNNGRNDDFALARFKTNGTIDTTFSGDGKVTTDIGMSTDIGLSVTLQADGKILVAGSSNYLGDDDFALARYNSDGTLDTTFSDNGIVTTDIGKSSDFGYSVTVQADGKILVVGSTEKDGNNDFALVRYNTDGTLDTSLSRDGKVATHISTSNDVGRSVTVQADGKILVAGSSGNAGNYDYALVRYNTNGTLDTTFGAAVLNNFPTGKVTITGNPTQGQTLTAANNLADVDGMGTVSYQWFANGQAITGATTTTYTLTNAEVDQIITVTACYTDGHGTTEIVTSNATSPVANISGAETGIVTTDIGKFSAGISVTLLPDNKILVAGITGISEDPRSHDIALARYNNNGTLDRTFSGDGKITTDIFWTDFCSDVKVQADGKILVAGQSPYSGNWGFSLLRYNTDGTLDTTFSDDGILASDPSIDYNDSDIVTLQSDGKILVAGIRLGGFVLVRYNTDGTLDTTFGKDGKQTTYIPEKSISYCSDVTVQADGKILIGGTTARDNNGKTSFALMCYNAYGNLVEKFSDGGILTTYIGWHNYLSSITVQDDGKILAAGSSDSHFALVRYNSDGTLDRSFSDDGKQTTTLGYFDDRGRSAKVQADGKILVAGYSKQQGGSYDFALARYNSDGSLDNSFSGDGKVTTDFGGTDDFGKSVTVQADGKILVAGTSNGQFALVRYNTNGTLDTTFGSGVLNNVPTGKVTITGAPTQYQTLTAVNTLADLDGMGTVSYQWIADGQTIKGATSTTYTLMQTDVGKIVAVTASYTDGQGKEESVTSLATAAVANVNDLPTGTVSITDTAIQGQKLTAANTLADADGLATISYQWLADGTAISGATGSTLTLSQAQVGKAISVRASYIDQYGTAESVSSAATAKVANINDPGSVSISGSATQGQPLDAVISDADGVPLVGITYQWLANGAVVKGATAATFTPTQAEVNKTLTVKASYKDLFGAAESLTSAATSKVANVNDAPTGGVTVSGTATKGQKLTAANTLTDADGLGTITYQWLADGAVISGATGSTLTLTQAQVGMAISVRASYVDQFGTAESVSSSATAKVANINDPGSVSISGSATQGQPLGAVISDADGVPLAGITYQWLANGAVVKGATAATFTPTQAEVNKSLTVKASYKDLFGTTESLTSPATSKVVNVNDAPTGGVTVRGTAIQGRKLTAVNTLADADGLGTITYQWLADDSAISGATGTTLTLTQAQVGKAISVRASYKDLFRTAESVSSAATAKVVNMNDAPTGGVTISGTATQGRTLTAANTLADADGLGTITYQWLADGTAISGASGNTFTLTQAQVGKAISVKASYVDQFGTAESVRSAATAKVVNVNDAPTGGVTVSGTATQGQKLTAANTLADADGLGTITYQWLADGAVISGATGSTLTLTQVQVGKAISVRAGYKDLFGTAESVSSAATDKVANVNDLPTGGVTVSGTVTQGQKLTAANTLADADGLGTITYQWLAGGGVISGATGSTLTLTQAQVGKAISVRASYTDKLGTAESVTSPATAMVASLSKTGTAGNDLLVGGAGNDLLSGLAGDDVIYGGLGNDTLVGGAGADILTGGAGNDSFKFTALTELGLGAAARDVIADFMPGQDKIDLSAIDTNPSKTGDQAFVWVSSFTATAGQARFVADDQGNGILYLNTDMDTDAEYEILLTGITMLAAKDLIL